MTGAISNHFIQKNNLATPLRVAGCFAVISAVALLILTSLGFSNICFLGLNTLGNSMLFAGAVASTLCAIVLFTYSCHKQAVKIIDSTVKDVVLKGSELDFHKENWSSFRKLIPQPSPIFPPLLFELGWLILSSDYTLKEIAKWMEVSSTWREYILSNPAIVMEMAQRKKEYIFLQFNKRYNKSEADLRRVQCLLYYLYQSDQINNRNDESIEDLLKRIHRLFELARPDSILKKIEAIEDDACFAIACEELAYCYIEMNEGVDWELTLIYLMDRRQLEEANDLIRINEIRDQATLTLARRGEFVAAVEGLACYSSPFEKDRGLKIIACQMAVCPQSLKDKKLQQLLSAEKLSDTIHDGPYRDEAYSSIAIAYALLQEIDLSYHVLLKIENKNLPYAHFFISAAKELWVAELMASNECPKARDLFGEHFSRYEEGIKSHIAYREALKCIEADRLTEALACGERVKRWDHRVDLYSTLGIQALVADKKEILKEIADKVPLLFDQLGRSMPWESKLEQQLFNLIFIQAKCGLVKKVISSLVALTPIANRWNKIDKIAQCAMTLGLFAQAFKAVESVDKDHEVERFKGFMVIESQLTKQIPRPV